MTPVTTSIKVSYSIGMKINLGNYESADFHLSEGHEIDVTGLDADAVTALADETRAEIATRLGNEIVTRAIAGKQERDF